MVNEHCNRDLSQPDERSSSGAAIDLLWDEWDELSLPLPDDDLRDAFELDDTLEDPQPEYGDFWPELD